MNLPPLRTRKGGRARVPPPIPPPGAEVDLYFSAAQPLALLILFDLHVAVDRPDPDEVLSSAGLTCAVDVLPLLAVLCQSAVPVFRSTKSESGN